jgi:hypothetical protein
MMIVPGMKKIFFLLLALLPYGGLRAEGFGEFVTEQDIQDQLSQTEILVKEGKASPEDLAKLRQQAQAALEQMSLRNPSERIEKFPELRTRSGKVYRSVVVRSREPDGISVMHEEGTAKIYYTDLSLEMQEHFHYDEHAAKAYQQQVANEQYRSQQTEKEKKREQASKEAEEQARKANKLAEAAKAREEARKKAEEESRLRLLELQREQEEAQKPILSSMQLRNPPAQGYFYTVPIPWQSLEFVKETGRKFYIPLKLSDKRKLKIRIRGGQDNSGDGGMRWEIRDYKTNKKLDAGFTREAGVYEANVNNIPGTEVMLILFDDDTDFYDSQPGNGFAISLQ